MNTLQRLRPFIFSMLLFWALLVIATSSGCGLNLTPAPLPINTPRPVDTSTPEPNFNYNFRVTNAVTSQAIKGAEITLVLIDESPKYRFTDEKGYATFQIDSKNEGQSAQAIIEGDGFQSQPLFVNIAKGNLPYDIRLTPLSGTVENIPTPIPIKPTATVELPPPTEQTTETPTQIPTQTQIPETATFTPQPTETGRPTDLSTATAVLQASIFAEPNSNSEELAYLEPDDEVTVIAITPNGSWLLVRDDNDHEGFVASNRLEYSATLNPPTLTPSPTPWASPTPAIVPTYAPLSIDFWDLIDTGRCAGGQWYKRIYIRGLGGDLNYTYYYFNDIDRQAQYLAERYDDSFTFEVAGTGTTALRLTGKVHSSDGQTAQRMIVVEPHLCP